MLWSVGVLHYQAPVAALAAVSHVLTLLDPSSIQGFSLAYPVSPADLSCAVARETRPMQYSINGWRLPGKHKSLRVAQPEKVAAIPNGKGSQ